MLEAFTDKAKQNLKEGVPPNPEDVDFEQLNETLNKAIQEQAAAGMMSFIGNFAVSGDTYYVEYGQALYRWKPGMSEWHNTGLVDKGEDPFLSLLSGPFDYSADVSTSYDAIGSMGFKIAVSGSTVYVGKRDGHLSQSFDDGDTWNDVTTDLPFSFEKFKAIAFAGPMFMWQPTKVLRIRATEFIGRQRPTLKVAPSSWFDWQWKTQQYTDTPSNACIC